MRSKFAPSESTDIESGERKTSTVISFPACTRVGFSLSSLIPNSMSSQNRTSLFHAPAFLMSSVFAKYLRVAIDPPNRECHCGFFVWNLHRIVFFPMWYKLSQPIMSA